ncbi:hypothetical protein QBC34DRAFT_379234 [Podospora aff. communis PSN243]|uniref:Uncharacterized protein n=1 Tax=Podospora aff. communis PSN243 TaxID=3040156 RepID=A0AAV9GQ41_9PEZI|nr:hypothetical protein QBC34DRAFT_379234 [Podospora aff. communis PSN243]
MQVTSIVTLLAVAFGTASAITISLPSGVSIPSGVTLPSGVTVVSAAATTTAAAAAGGNAAGAKRQLNFGSLSLRQAFGGQQTRSSSAAGATAGAAARA